MQHDLTDSERQWLDDDGYLVRHAVFSPTEVAELVAASEQLVTDVLTSTRRRRLEAGAYVFEPQPELSLSIKWEGDSTVVHGIEPCAHVSPVLQSYALDGRLVHPMRALVQHDDPQLFTEKLNLKRPHHGGEKIGRAHV